MWEQGLIREFVEALVPNKNTVKNKCERCQELLRYNKRNHKFINTLLPPANEVWGKVIFLHLFVILFIGEACVVARGHAWLWGHAWLLGGGVVARGCVWLWGGMHGCGGHVLWGMCAWLWGDVLVVGGVHGWGHAWLWGGVRRIRRDTVNERAVRILLECIHVDL